MMTDAPDETPLYAAPVADRVSTSNPVDDRAAPKTSGKLRDAVEVWRYASDAATLGSVKYKPAADEAAAAIIEQDRAALIAEIVEYLRQLDATRDESNLIGWAANRVQAEFGGTALIKEIDNG